MGRCALCELYQLSRGDLIRAEIAKTASGGVAVRQFHEFMAGVHERHIAQARERIRSFGRVTALMAHIADELNEETPSP